MRHPASWTATPDDRLTGARTGVSFRPAARGRLDREPALERAALSALARGLRRCRPAAATRSAARRARWLELGGADPGGPGASFRARIGEPVDTTPLADFLTARWGMFTRRGSRTLFVPNEHPPWQLHSAELLSLDDELLSAAGLPGLAGTTPDSVLYSPGVTTRFGRPSRQRPTLRERLKRGSGGRYRTRTDDLFRVKEARYQLRQSPATTILPHRNTRSRTGSVIRAAPTSHGLECVRSSDRVMHAPGNGSKMRMWRSGSASPCQGEGREFESRHPLEWEVSVPAFV